MNGRGETRPLAGDQGRSCGGACGGNCAELCDVCEQGGTCCGTGTGKEGIPTCYMCKCNPNDPDPCCLCGKWVKTFENPAGSCDPQYCPWPNTAGEKLNFELDGYPGECTCKLCDCGDCGGGAGDPLINNDATYVRLPSGDCIWMDCFGDCPFPECEEE